MFEITSGLPDDSREEDERAQERRLRELRARVKAARAVVASTSGLAETLARDWRKAAWFYAGFAITERMFRCGGAPGAEPCEAGVVRHGTSLDSCVTCGDVQIRRLHLPCDQVPQDG